MTKPCNCPAYPFPHRLGSGACGKFCQHPQVEIVYRLWAAETRFQPAEYAGRAECIQCGTILDLDDVPTWAYIRYK